MDFTLATDPEVIQYVTDQLDRLILSLDRVYTVLLLMLVVALTTFIIYLLYRFLMKFF